MDNLPRFQADAMLGRLARWLRLLGFDTGYRAHIDDAELAALARAQRRIVLTRDREFTGVRPVESVLIRSENLEEQLTEVLSASGGPPPAGVSSRCMLCNEPIEEVENPEEVGDRVPEYVLRSQDRFRRCPSCGRIYWEGSHYGRMREVIERIRGGAGGRGP